jgi:hypothetical protein
VKSPFHHPESYARNSEALPWSTRRARHRLWYAVRPEEPFEVDGIVYDYENADNVGREMIELINPTSWSDPQFGLYSEPELPEEDFRAWLASGIDEDLLP